MQRAADAARAALAIEVVGDGAGVGIHLEDVVEARSALVEIRYAAGVQINEPARRHVARGHLRLQLGDRLL